MASKVTRRYRPANSVASLSPEARQLGRGSMAEFLLSPEVQKVSVDAAAEIADNLRDGLRDNFSSGKLLDSVESAHRDIAERMSGRTGGRDVRRAGAAGELDGSTRPWEFGDTEPWNVTATVGNAVRRVVAEGGDPRSGVRLSVDDVEVDQTGRTPSA